ncbi:MAG: 50S ribosomal protein L30 [Acidimicrobiales bacterium]
MTDHHGAAAEPSTEGGSLRVTQVRSAIGVKPAHRGTLRALGLGGIGKVNHLPDRPEIRGMIARVPHLVEVVESDDRPTGRPRPVTRSPRRRPRGPAGSGASTDGGSSGKDESR